MGCEAILPIMMLGDRQDIMICKVYPYFQKVFHPLFWSVKEQIMIMIKQEMQILLNNPIKQPKCE